MRDLLEAALHADRDAAHGQDAEGHIDDRDQRRRARDGAAEARLVRRAVRSDAVCALSGVGVRGAGLYKREKRFAIPLVVSSIVLFYAGVAFAYFVVFPLMFGFLTSTAPVGVQVMTDMTNYLDFVVLLFFAFGVAFEIPVATVLLAATGLVRVETMAKNRGYVVLGIFVIAAFLTPPDAISQSFMAVPMYLLYEIGIVLSRVLLREKLAQEKAVSG